MEAGRIARAMMRRLGMDTGNTAYFMQYRDELIDAAFIGLCVGVQRYVPNQNCKIGSYVYQWIRHHVALASNQAFIYTSTRKNKRYEGCIASSYSNVRDGKTMRFDVWDNRYGEDPCPDPAAPQELVTLLHLVIDQRRVRIVTQVVFFDRTLMEVARDEGLSKQRIHAILRDSMAKLADRPSVIDYLRRSAEEKRRESRSDFSHRNMGMRIA